MHKDENMHSAHMEAIPMLPAAISKEERKWYDRIKFKILSGEWGYYCSWWLRLDYKDEDENLTTAKINYWLTKLVKKGFLTKETTKSYTAYRLTDKYHLNVKNENYVKEKN